ncbi:MAG: hypothetical protein LC808_30150 [Actinobacteria bacterium]|nr:hypothetical protein [Actinomycetota bacterium]
MRPKHHGVQCLTPALPIDEAIDACAAGLGPADLIFVFGTRLAEPARRGAAVSRVRRATAEDAPSYEPTLAHYIAGGLGEDLAPRVGARTRTPV